MIDSSEIKVLSNIENGEAINGMTIEETAKGVEKISKLDNTIKKLELQGFSSDQIAKGYCLILLQ